MFSLLMLHVYKTNHLAMHSAFTNIYERTGRSKELTGVQFVKFYNQLEALRIDSDSAKVTE